MKIRKGFVSNSSSSSFICDLCGESHSGWDINVYAVGGYECENGHVVCCLDREFDSGKCVEIFERDIANNNVCEFFLDRYNGVIKNDNLSEQGKKSSVIEIAYEYCTEDVLPESLCAICRMDEIAANDLKNYLQTITKITEAEILIEIKKENKRRRKVYTYEYIDYALNNLNKTKDSIIKEIKEKFKTYEDFVTFRG